MDKEETISLKDRVLLSIEKIRPYLIADGGDIELADIINDSIVNVRVLGACGECKFLSQTMRALSEKIIKDSPEITQVNALD